MPLSFRLFSVRFSFVCFGIGLYFLASGILGEKINYNRKEEIPEGDFVMPLSFRLFSVRFSFVCFGIGLYFLASGILGEKINYKSFKWYSLESASWDCVGDCSSYLVLGTVSGNVCRRTG